MNKREKAVQNIKDNIADWNDKNADRYGAIDPKDITIGEVENELLRIKGLPECPMYDRDYSEGWR